MFLCIDCSFVFDAPEGVIRSPGFPHLSNDKMSCTYKIVSEPKTVISMQITEFDLKDTDFWSDSSCAGTFIKVKK